MEIRHRILQFNDSPKYELLRRNLDRLGASYKIKRLGILAGKEHCSIEFIVSEDDPLFPMVAELINEHDFHAQVGVHYSQEDIEAAEWVYAVAGEYQYPQPADDGGYREATYDVSDYCVRCGMGAVQVRPFRLKRDFKQKGSRFLGLHWVFDEMFVRPEIKAFFEGEKVSGVEFSHPVQHNSGKEIEDVYQMVVRTVANPGLVTEGLSTVTCKPDNEESYVEGIGRVPNRLGDYPYCGRVKYHYPRRYPISFREEDLRGLPDFAKSHEYLGSGAAAHRLILVRKRVVALIEKQNLRGLKFTPVEVI